MGWTPPPIIVSLCQAFAPIRPMENPGNRFLNSSEELFPTSAEERVFIASLSKGRDHIGHFFK